MKGTKRTSVIAMALALVLALSVLVGAGIAPAVNEGGNAPVDNGQIKFVVKCQHEETVNATITGTATYTLVPSEEPEPSTEPSEEPSEQPVEPSAPAEPSTEPSEQPVEPSAPAAEPSEQPAEPSTEPSEQPVEPSAPVVEPSNPVVEPDKTITKAITGASVYKAITENGYDYTLTSLKYTVTAKGYEGPTEKTVNAADIENNTIPVEMTDIAPTMSANWSLEDKKVSITANDAKDDNAPVVVIFVKDQGIVDAIKDPTAQNHPKNAGLGGFEVKNEGNKLVVTKDSQTKIKKAMVEAYGEEAAVFDKNDNMSTCFLKVTENGATNFGNVTNMKDERGIIVIDSHGNVTAEVINKYYNVVVSDADKWTAKKTVTVTLNSYSAEHRIVITGPNKFEKTFDKDNITSTESGKCITFDITQEGTYRIATEEYKLVWVGYDWREVRNSAFEFTVSNIDTIAPEVTVEDEGSVINHITASANDKGGSGIASVCLAKVDFGYVQAKNTDGTDKTEVKPVDIGQNEDGTKKTQDVTVPVYQGTINGVAVGAEVTAEVEVINGSPSIKDKDAQNTAIANAKEFFEDNKNDSEILDIITANEDNFYRDETKEAKNGEKVELPVPGDTPDAIAVWAIDGAGNASSIEKIYGKIVDNDKPKISKVEYTIQLSENGSDDSYGTDQTITVTADDKNLDKIFVVYQQGEKKAVTQEITTENTAEFVIPNNENHAGDGDYIIKEIYAVDKAGNKSDITTPAGSFTIDTIDPQMKDLAIALVNKGKTQEKTNDKDYYGGDAKITFTVVEDHFASGELYYTKDSASDPSEIKVEIDQNKEFSYTFNPDGVYQLNKLVLTDKAGNTHTYWLDETKAEGAHEDSQSQAEFTVDHIVPTISVKYNNNDVRNDKYFNAERTATITISETNFNGTINWGKVDTNGEMKSGVYIVCSKNGAEVKNKPADLDPSDWKDNEDKHTMTIKYDPDANYTFDVYVVDRAGNYTAYEKKATEDAVSPTDFTVDKTKPTITVTGITNGSAYNGEVAGTVEFNDVNFNGGTIKLTRADKNSVYDVTAQHVGALPVRGNGGSVSIANFDRLLTNDGIYTLSVTAIDMAGNEADPVTVTFSVNRFGSTYKFDDYLASICDQHIKSVTSDLKITEINPDSITNGTVTITRNGKVIDSGDIAPALQRSASASGGWYEYLYTISKDLFKEDGMYKIVVSSKDAAGNEPNSENDDDFEIVFWVDDTPAEISGIQGLEEAIVNAENHTVKFTVRDNIGLKSVTVYCDDKEIAKFGEKDFTAGDLVDAEFTISEASSAQHIRIVAEDLSGNVLDTDGSIEGSVNTGITFERDVTVSTNFFVRWFANKPLFFGSIAVIVAAGVGIYFIVAKKHKKEETKA